MTTGGFVTDQYSSCSSCGRESGPLTLVLSDNLEQVLTTGKGWEVLPLLLQALCPSKVTCAFIFCSLLHVLGELRVGVLPPVVLVAAAAVLVGFLPVSLLAA